MKNTELNGLKNLHPFKVAVSDRNGSTNLYIPRGHGGWPTEASTLPGFREALETVVVETVTLDDFCEEHSVNRVDLMKIDTESTEPEVLRGALRVIRRDLPVIICEVLQAETGTLIQQSLAGLNYQYFWITRSGLVEQDVLRRDEEGRCLNFLFVPESKVAELLKDIKGPLTVTS